MKALAIGSFLAAVLLTPAGGRAPADQKPAAGPPGNAKATDGKDRELHAVGLYEGYTKSNGVIHGDRARVAVNRPGRRVTLALVAYNPMTWEVAVGKGTTVERVVLGGRGRAAVKGLPEGVEVVEAFRGSKDARLPFYAYDRDGPGFRAIVEALAEMTGQKLASFSGSYSADPERPIAVEGVSDDERLSADYPRPVPAAGRPELTFRAHLYVPGRTPHEVTGSFGEFTPAGPKADTLRPLPDHVSRLTYDPAGKKYYGIFRHKLAEVDLEKGTVREIDTGLDVPEISWPADVTFDAKRERVLLTSSGGGGYLYAYDPKAVKWEALAEKPAPVVTYHPKDDTVYGLRGDRHGGGPELQTINAKGAVVASVRLDGQFLPGMFDLGPGVGGVQLVPAGDRLALLVSPVRHLGSETPPAKWSYIYLVDQKTGKAQLVWKEKVGGK